jgi:Zn-dependent protease/predicted transcriptional regulator
MTPTRTLGHRSLGDEGVAPGLSALSLAQIDPDDELVEQSLHLGTWRGVRIFGHWSLLIVGWLLSWSMASTLFPRQAPGYSTSAYWLGGILTAAAFLIAIGAHEMAHAVVAQQSGVGVKCLTLWLFGGIAELLDQPRTWKTQLRIALAGPIASAAIGGTCIAVAAVLSILDASTLVRVSLVWLGGTNLILAAFNLLPGAPLDGGRVLAALRWRHHGDARRARREAANAGFMLGQAMVASGIWLAFFVNVGTGLWIAFLGWFVTSAARREATAETVDQSLSGVRVSDVMVHHPTTVPPSMTVAEVVDRVINITHHTSLPVVLDRRPVGLITPKQIRAVPMSLWDSVTAGKAALDMARVPTAVDTELLADVLHRVGSDQARIVVVDTDGRVCGLITPTDIVKTVQRELLRRRLIGPIGVES